MADILISADLHIHAHKKSVDRLHDCLKVLEWIFETAKEQSISSIVIAGDLFQDRQKIDVLTYNLTFDLLAKYLDGSLKLYLLLGNHDLWYFDRWNISSVQPLSALPGVTVINQACSILIENETIDFLPFIRDPIDYLNKFNSKAKVLIGHLAIHNAKFNSKYSDVIVEHDGEMVKIDAELFKKWDKVWLGHYHAAQKIKNIEYVGSPLQLNFGEAFQKKHIVIYNVRTGKTEYVANNFSPQHFVIPESDIEKYDIEKNFIRVQVEDTNTVGTLELKEKIAEKQPGSLEIQAAPKEDTKQEIQDAKAVLAKEDEMLESYLEQVDIGDLNKERLLEIGKEICTYEES